MLHEDRKIGAAQHPFRGTVDAAGSKWKEVELPAFKTGEGGMPFLALDAYGVRIYQKEGL